MSTDPAGRDAALAFVKEFIDESSDEVPLLRSILKVSTNYLKKGKIRDVLKEGRAELHEAGVRLGSSKVKTALQRIGEFEALLTTQSRIDSNGTKLERRLDEISFYRIDKKCAIRLQVVQWKEYATAHKEYVHVKSDRAILGLNLDDGSLPGDHGGETAAPSDDSASVAEETLVAEIRSILTTIDDNDAVSVTLSIAGDSRGDTEHSETHSIFGNPWAGYERPSEDNAADV